MDINWYPGHMAKSKRLLMDQLSRVDVVVELCDARIPFSSRNPDLGQLVSGKRRVLLLNKADLAEPGITGAWVRHFREEGLDAAPFEASRGRSGQGINLISQAAQEAVQKALGRRVRKTVKAMVVGVPNVGKSTILSVVTSARPKIANYHFTTLTPNLGMVRHHGEDFIMADIPGLVEGAADGTGLGHAFLRHVERTRLLLHVVDASGSEGRDPVVDFDTINLELSRYGNLAELPQILVCNKADLPGFDENLERLKAHVADRNIPVFSVSAATRKGFDPLMNQVIQLLKTLPPIQSFPETLEEEEAMERPDGFQIEMEGKIYHVLGPSMERLLNSINFDDEESLNYFHRTLRRMGVIDALREKGAKEGDTVQIEDMAFDFVD